MQSTRETVRIRSADNVAFGYDVAGLGTRTAAFLLDLLLIAVVDVVLVIAAAFTAQALDPSRDTSVLAAVLSGSVAILGFIAYFTICEAFTAGRTPGKRAMGLRVVRLDGGSIGLVEGLTRGIVRLLDLLAGPVVMFIDPRCRRLGDFAAGTIVVREGRVHSATTVPLMAAPVFLRTNEPGPAIDGLDRVGRHEHTILRQFFGRPDLPPPQRLALAQEMSLKLFDRMHLAPTSPERTWPAELFLERLYLQLDLRLQAGR